MKRAALSLALLWPWSGGSLAETPAPAEPGTVAEFTAAVAQLDRERAEKLLAVDAAIRVMAQQGRLSVVTEAYYLNVLSLFRETSPIQPETPPRFDASPEMEPINTAWAELRGEELRQNSRRFQLVKLLQAAATAALQTAVRQAEKPEDLQTARDLYEYLGVLTPNPFRLSYMTNSSLESLSTLIPPIMEALAARQTKDVPRLRRAFLNLTPGPPGEFGPARPPPSFGQSTGPRQSLVDEFRNRLLADYVRDIREAQTALEKAIMARRPTEDLERAYSKLVTMAGPLRLLEAAAAPRETVPPPFPRRNDSTEKKWPLAESCVAAFAFYDEAIARLADPRTAATLPVTNSAGTEVFGLGSEFRDFLVALRRETQPPATAGAPSSQPAAPAPKLTRKALLAQIAEIRTPEQAAACAEAMRQAPPTSERNDPFAVLEPELRRLALQWQTGTLATSRSRQNSDAYSSPELEPVRQRAFRDQTARRLELPELLQPPLAETPLPEALGKAAVQATDRHQWRRALALYRASDQDAGHPSEQARAIEEFLIAGQMEQAGLYVEAAATYENVLRQVAEHTPVPESAARMKLLRTEHPDAFKDR